jgi:RNA polymerase sigma-70 factor (ECF subfamily)
MEQQNTDRDLNQISTLWSLVTATRDGPTAEVSAAQQQLLLRYGKAVHRYLLGAVRDAELAEDLSQEFALRFVRGDLRGADPGRGRFRDYVKGVLFHLVADHHRQRQRAQPLPLPDPGEVPAAPAATDAEAQFLESWRDELLTRAWEALARVQQQTGKPFHTALSLKADHPGLKSAQLAERLAAHLGKPVTAAGFRQTLHRARAKFEDFVIGEVVQTLDAPTLERLEQELLDLRLLDYCRAGLARFQA